MHFYFKKNEHLLEEFIENSIAVGIFILLMVILHLLEPEMSYDKKGAFRE